MSRLNGDQYMDLLVQRRDAYYAEHGQPRPGFPALLDWFIQDGDEELFTPPPEAPQPKRETKPRTYRSAASLIEERDRLQQQLDHLYDSIGIKDRAATGGEALGARRTRAFAARTDNALARCSRLDDRIRALNGRISRAKARERDA